MKDFLWKKMALPTIVLIWSASYYIEVMGYSVKNHRMIQPLFWVMVALYIINGITDYKEWKKEKTVKEAEAPDKENRFTRKGIDKAQVLKLAALVVSMIVYVALLNAAGFVLTTLLFTCAVLFLMGERKWFLLAGIPILLVAALYAAFKLGLGIPLPPGFLGF